MQYTLRWFLRNVHRVRRKLLAATFSRKSQLMKRSMTSSYNKSHSQAACLIYREAIVGTLDMGLVGAIVAVMCHPGVYVLGASFCLVALLPFFPERKKAWLSSCWPCLEMHYSPKSRCDLCKTLVLFNLVRKKLTSANHPKSGNLNEACARVPSNLQF